MSRPLQSSRAPSRSPVSVLSLLLFVLVSLGADGVFASQIIRPANESMFSSKFSLKINFPSMVYLANITPLTPEAGQQNINPLKGIVQLITDSTVNSLDNTVIAYINCDPDGHSSEDDIFRTATGRYPVAIVLYSTTSPFCTLTPSARGAQQYNALYSMASANSASMFESLLKQSPANIAVIGPSDTNAQATPTSVQGGSGGGGSGLGASPTTTVAMIILYSITGLVTALFLIIIATGAIRAHRHPERYGPRMTGPLGRQRQSRAKGLARAVLESIPIVKFGEKDDKRPGGDVELGADQQRPAMTGGDGAADTAGDRSQRSEPEDRARDGDASRRTGEGSAVTPANPPAEGDGDQIQPSVERPPTPDDAGLSCSICTEDFVKGEDIRVLPCNHKYHPDCVDPWLLNVSGTCPLCRIDLTNNLNHDPDSSSSSPNANNASDSLPPPLDFPPGTSSTQTDSDTTTPPSRRSRYLDLRRLAHAHPEERLSILRWLREANQQARDQDGLQRRRASRLSGVFRVFGIRNGRSDEQGQEGGSGSSPTRSASPPTRNGSPLARDGSPARNAPPAESVSPPTAGNGEAAREGAEAERAR
ncbi:MAG: hypothetical protein M1839_007629 [Geoglossum umbratile]|nr:MAG: hypothetical protein M1839_007629 [Geoglossum umbratile]